MWWRTVCRPPPHPLVSQFWLPSAAWGHLRVPRGLGGPSVESTAVCSSVSALSSAPRTKSGYKTDDRVRSMRAFTSISYLNCRNGREQTPRRIMRACGNSDTQSVSAFCPLLWREQWFCGLAGRHVNQHNSLRSDPVPGLPAAKNRRNFNGRG
jgi:hypothetical protein